MVGLGRMGANMTLRLMRHSHEVVAWDRNEESVKGVASEGADGVGSLEDLVKALDRPRAVWVMLPSGEPTEATIRTLEDVLDKGDEFSLDLHQIAEVWRYGSVVRSWLLDLAALALDNQEEFGKIRGFVEDSGEGRWTIDEAVARGVATPVMAVSLFERFQSREPDSFAAKIIAALRNQFGGHKFFEESARAETG